ncbi:HNH endonuclease [Pseudalkalibacillus hwajinpoensis]|uniref:HNH endonuclease n=1 Tax=Guptibacillus hwajinpoensis TaxID=208199 RepID=UPI001CFC75C8|nr:HNH endonuclease [Pseudalkalibacillus hwajinpoensis]
MINEKKDYKIPFTETMYPANSRIKYFNILNGGTRKEIQFKKYIYEFNLNEIEELIKSYDIKTFNSVRVYAQTIKSYIKYCVELKLIKVNPLDDVFNINWLSTFLDKKVFITDQELKEVINKCKNPQDAVLLQLTFEGVLGKGCSELLNLKTSDIINGTTLKLNDHGNIRYIEVSKACIDLIYEADKQTVYYKKNGKTEAKSKTSNLFSNGFVIKTIKSEKKNRDNYLISRRITSLASVLNLPQGSPKFFNDSGKVSLAKNIYMNLGYVDEKLAQEEISKQFNIKKQKQKGKFYLAQGLKEYTNPDIIYDVYKLRFDCKFISPFKLIDESKKEANNSTTEVIKRTKQEKFRDDIMLNYEEKCCVTGESIVNILESAHIQRYINEYSHHQQNGLLLRVDFHRLFDKGLITITPDYVLLVSNNINSKYYQSYNGIKIRLPVIKNYYPSKVALKHHNDKFIDNFVQLKKKS